MATSRKLRALVEIIRHGETGPMDHLKKCLARIVAGVLIAFGGLAISALPAQATTWYPWNGWCGSFYSHPCSVEYTGAWPGSYVRAVGTHDVYEVALEVRVGSTGSWLISATTFPENGG